MLLAWFITFTLLLTLAGIGVCLLWSPIKESFSQEWLRWTLIGTYILLIALFCLLWFQPWMVEVLKENEEDEHGMGEL